MSNWYKLSGALDRQYLRTSAVYRCMRRYHKSKEWGIDKCADVGIKREVAQGMIEGWFQSVHMRDHPGSNRYSRASS